MNDEYKNFDGLNNDVIEIVSSYNDLIMIVYYYLIIRLEERKFIKSYIIDDKKVY